MYDIYLPPARLAQTEYTPVLRETCRGFLWVNPQVIADGDLAVLSYNLAKHVCAEDGSETAGTSWNSTQVYRRKGDGWRVADVHWAFTRHPAATQGLMA